MVVKRINVKTMEIIDEIELNNLLTTLKNTASEDSEFEFLIDAQILVTNKVEEVEKI